MHKVAVTAWPQGRSAQQTLTKTATSLGALMTDPEGEASLEMCCTVTALRWIRAGNRMTTWP